MMKLIIVGAGAMGSLFASYLARVSDDVWVYDFWREHIDAIRERGLIVTRGKADYTVKLKATSNPKEPGVADLIIILVKYNHTRQAIEDARPMIGRRTVVLTLQNGIGNVEILQEVVPTRQIFFGLTTLPSELIGPGHITDSGLGQGETYFWPLSGRVGRMAEKMRSLFNRSGIRTEISAGIELMIWKKLVVNCSYAAVSAITRLRAGSLLNMTELEPILDGVLSEIVQIANKKGIPLKKNEARTFAQRIAEEGKDHIPSMLADLLKKRKTEVECLNGAIIREGKRLKITTPFNQVLYGLVRTVEDTYSLRLE